MVKPPEVPRILAVDDSNINLNLLRRVLGNAGFDVVTSEEATSVLDLVLEERPDLVLLDLMMPGMDGLAVLGQLKGHFETQDLPVLMVTARTDGADVSRALEAGAFDYIKKPLDHLEIIARVRSALRFKETQARLTEMATHDGLTGLFNHRLMVEFLGRELMATQRKGTATSYCMADVDHFKAVNDEFGHQAGDQVLRAISRVLDQGVRRSDLVGRYGGEEFGVVLRECPGETAQILCERLRTRVSQLVVDLEGKSIRTSISLGLVSVGPDEAVDAAEVIHRADRALYQAKSGGRNRLVVWTGP